MDSKTPFYVSIASIIFNAALSFCAIAIAKMPVWALGLTFSLTISIQVVVMLVIYASKINGFSFKTLMFETSKVVVASSLSSLVAYDIRKLLDGLIFDTSRTLNLLFLMIITFAIMTVTYIFAVWTLDSRGLFILSKVIIGIKTMPKRLSTFFSPVEAQ